ncbi:hypothetical protein [Cyanobium gracile]|uniref:Uncharacterized protein n=1 Tax=Cyanobium gracile UHCC 0281 TaxID=3110309 RepID=A0ABU5SY29_9CYAN|nr:hypothetical protein [Cyanobium gracile]MEA5443430.1 hypothetical protein [Cyanobium gracile UHCC 0281]
MSPIFPGRSTAQTILYWRGVGLVQCWRSFEALECFSKTRRAAAWDGIERRHLSWLRGTVPSYDNP